MEQFYKCSLKHCGILIEIERMEDSKWIKIWISHREAIFFCSLDHYNSWFGAIENDTP